MRDLHRYSRHQRGLLALGWWIAGVVLVIGILAVAVRALFG